MLGIQLRDASDRANNSRNSIEAERGAWTERLASSRDSLDAELAAAAKLHDAGLASAEEECEEHRAMLGRQLSDSRLKTAELERRLEDLHGRHLEDKATLYEQRANADASLQLVEQLKQTVERQRVDFEVDHFRMNKRLASATKMLEDVKLDAADNERALEGQVASLRDEAQRSEDADQSLLTQIRAGLTASNADLKQVQQNCDYLSATCTRLRETAGPCATCSDDGATATDDKCPAKLEKALKELREANDYIAAISDSFELLRNQTKERLADCHATIDSRDAALEKSEHARHLLATDLESASSGAEQERILD